MGRVWKCFLKLSTSPWAPGDLEHVGAQEPHWL